MYSALLNVLAKYNYLPETYSNKTVDEALEKFILDATEDNNLIEGIHEINKLLGLNVKRINQKIDPEYSGPFCPYLTTNLESLCELKSCPNFNSQHRWNCQLLGSLRVKIPTSDVTRAVQLFTKEAGAEIIGVRLAPKYTYVECSTNCIFCGSATQIQLLSEAHAVCKSCINNHPGKLLRLQLEVRFGRTILSILDFAIHEWHNIQEQSQALGINTLQMQELCDIFCINPRKYKLQNERRFVNPFYTRRKSRPVIDGSLFRLYSKYIIIRRLQRTRPEIKQLSNALLSQTNTFLKKRKLMLFNLTQADF